MRPRQPYTSALQALAWGLFGIFVFVIILIALEAYAAGQDSAFLSAFVSFLIADAWLIILMALMFMAGDIFATFPRPASLPGPFFSAAGAVLLVMFVAHVFRFLDSFYTIGFYPPFQALEPLVYPLIFIIVLVAGILTVAFRDEDRPREQKPPAGGDGEEERQCRSWEDVGEEFRLMWYDLFRRIREELKGRK